MKQVAESRTVTTEDVRVFWDAHPCGSALSDESDRQSYFSELAAKRYAVESHIPEVARFGDYLGRDVLEIGCGVGSDGLRFAMNGARYVGVDLSPSSVELARGHFDVFRVGADHLTVDASELPFDDERFDHVYSFGVIHHSPKTEEIVDEIFRVLRPGGTFCVMVYNKTSINYYVEIMLLRRIMKYALLPSFAPRLLSRIGGFDHEKLTEHQAILRNRKRFSKQEWISINTDGPLCPLAKVYSRTDVLRLFRRFDDIRTEVRFFDRRHWPLVRRLLSQQASDWLGRRFGWHRIVYGRKPFSPQKS